MNHPIKIEVCAGSVESAIAAQEGSADRVELCENIYEGGTTPSAGSIMTARRYLTIGLNVMIRPRGGDFCGSDLEFEIMKKDVGVVKDLQADGIVFGILKQDGQVDLERSKIIIELARPLTVTFHRAFDMTPDPFRALDDCVNLGVDRILTSGQRNKAVEGADLIAELVKKAGDALTILVGSGVDEQNIAELIHKTGAQEFHVSGRKRVDSVMTYRNPNVSMGGIPNIPEYEYSVTDAERIKSIVRIARSTG